MKRIEYIDIYRSIGIILMVLGHIKFGASFNHFIHAFHMPMFFFISGFLYRHKENILFKDFLCKKAKSLLIPYLCFGIISYLVYIFFNGFTLKPLYYLFFINTKHMPISGALWFLFALFWVDIIYFLIDKYVKSYIHIFVIIIALAGNVNQIYLPFTLPYALGCSFVGIGLFHIGYVLKSNMDKKIINSLFNLNWIILIVLTVIEAVLIFKNGYINVKSEKYAFIPLFWINAVLSSVLLMNYSKFIYSKIQNTKICNYLCGVGKNSIVYLCLNQLVIFFVLKYVNIHIRVLIKSSVRAIIVFVILYAFEMLITKTKLKFIIGKS